MNEENEYEEVWGKAASLDSTDFNKKLASLKLIMYGTGTKSTDETIASFMKSMPTYIPSIQNLCRGTNGR